MAVLGAAICDRHADRPGATELAFAAGVTRWARHRGDMPDRGPVPLRRTARMDRGPFVPRVLQRVTGLVQDLERSHGRGKHLHVAAGGGDDRADSRARGDLYAMA